MTCNNYYYIHFLHVRSSLCYNPTNPHHQSENKTQSYNSIPNPPSSNFPLNLSTTPKGKT